MEINLTQHANSLTRQKSSEGLLISDHTFDCLNFKGPLVFTGKGTRGVVIKNAHDIEITFKDCVIDNAGTGVMIKLDGRTNNVKLNGSGTTRLFGKVGNAQSQVIYVVGTWSNVEICGFDIDQRRDNKLGTTITGAACQMQGVLSSTHNLGQVHIHDMVIRNAGDEGIYVNHYAQDGGYCDGDVLIVENVKVFSSGRDFLQVWGFNTVVYSNCYGENGMKEGDANHMSALSCNGDTESLLIENCEFKNIAQLLYSGKPSAGKSINAIIRGVVYDQGTHAGSRSNSSVYAKGPGVYRFEECAINAPAVKIAVFSADGCKIEVSKDCEIVGPKLFRDPFNGGSYAEITPEPIVEKETTQIEVVKTTEWGQPTKTQYFLSDGTELKP